MSRHVTGVFLVFALVVGASLLGLGVLYPGGLERPGLDHGFIRFSLVFLLGTVAMGTMARSAVRSLIGGAVLFAILANVLVLTGGLTWHPDTIIDVLAVGIIGIGVGTTIGVLGRQAESAVEAERQTGLVSDLSVDLVPSSLDPDALEQLLTAVKNAAGATSVVLLPGNVEALDALVGQLPNSESVDEGIQRIASLMTGSSSGRGEDAGAARPKPEPLITADGRTFIPVLSSRGVEGVLFASRYGQAVQAWAPRQIGFLHFTANLLGALIERQHLQESATKAVALEEADRLKANLLLSVSHDLKTPIAAATATLTSVIDALHSGESAESAVDELMSVNEDLSVVNSSVTELIDIARLETSSWETNIEYNDVGDLVHLVRAAVGPRDRDRVFAEDVFGVPPFQFDLVQMGRALHHILQNALAYSPPGSRVTMRVVSDEDTVRIEVVDRGPGLSAEDREGMFEKFYRGSASKTAPHGSGLGLPIAEKIVTGHGGHIEVAGVEPTGTRVVVVLPRTQKERPNGNQTL
jgi:two-component system, OmpR family, sensor histidine kinase KdpD